MALFVSLGGVSYGVATGYIDSREIKNNTVSSKDIRNNNVTSTDLRNNSARGGDIRNNSLTGADVLESSLGGVPNATNATNAGQLGGAAANDYRRYSGTIPSGKTVIGAWGLHHNNLTDNEGSFVTISFPLKAPAPVLSGNINFAPAAEAADDDATCTGSYGDPTAPAGKVCIYLGGSVSNVDGLEGFQGGTPSDATSVFGFSIRGDANGAGVDVSARGTWAYTP